MQRTQATELEGDVLVQRLAADMTRQLEAAALPLKQQRRMAIELAEPGRSNRRQYRHEEVGKAEVLPRGRESVVADPRRRLHDLPSDVRADIPRRAAQARRLDRVDEVGDDLAVGGARRPSRRHHRLGLVVWAGLLDTGDRRRDDDHGPCGAAGDEAAAALVDLDTATAGQVASHHGLDEGVKDRGTACLLDGGVKFRGTACLLDGGGW